MLIYLKELDGLLIVGWTGALPMAPSSLAQCPLGHNVHKPCSTPAPNQSNVLGFELQCVAIGITGEKAPGPRVAIPSLQALLTLVQCTKTLCLRPVSFFHTSSKHKTRNKIMKHGLYRNKSLHVPHCLSFYTARHGRQNTGVVPRQARATQPRKRKHTKTRHHGRIPDETNTRRQKRGLCNVRLYLEVLLAGPRPMGVALLLQAGHLR